MNRRNYCSNPGKLRSTKTQKDNKFEICGGVTLLLSSGQHSSRELSKKADGNKEVVLSLTWLCWKLLRNDGVSVFLAASVPGASVPSFGGRLTRLIYVCYVGYLIQNYV